MSKQVVPIMLLVLFVLAGWLTVSAQRLELDQDGNARWVRDGDDIPFYLVVNSFLHRLDICRNAQDGGAAWKAAIERLGVRPKSVQEDALSTVVNRAKEIRTRSVDLAPHVGDREAFIGVQLKLLSGQVRDLEPVYRDLLQVVGGRYRKTLEQILEKEVRPSMTVTSFPDPDDEVFEIMESFMKAPPAGARKPPRSGETVPF